MISISSHGRVWSTLLLLCALIGATLLFFPLLSVKAAGSTVQVWVTTADRTELLQQQANIQFGSGGGSTNPTIAVDDTQQLQQMDGFGAAITDSSASLLSNSLSASQRNTVMQNLFGTNSANPTNIGLSFVRIPMGASDFSINGAYSYDDLPAGQSDSTLANFSISHDTAYILPILQQAHQLNPAIRFMANPWSPPAWMKTNGSMIGTVNGVQGTLNQADYGPLAQYFVKFLQAYQGAPYNIPIYAITPQNEPNYDPSNYPGMILQPSDEMNLINNYLSPALTSANLHPKILGLDFNWSNSSYAQSLLSDPTTNSNIAGIAWHCYGGNPTTMTTLHTQYPTKEAYETECATGATSITSFTAINLLMQSVKNWARSVELWNIALNPSGGPHSGGCGDCKGVVVIDQTTGNVTYSNDFYQLGQFSKFVAPGAYHIASTDPSGGTLSSAAFTNVNGNRVTVVYNSGSSASTFNVSWNGTQSFSYSLPAGAIASFVWSPSSSVTPTPTGMAGGTPTATPTSTPVSTPTPTPTQTPGSSCRVHYAITSQWSGGFSVTLTVTNTGSTAINGWRLQFAFPNGQTITQLWNGSYTQSGSTVTITNASYNASIPAGQSVSSAPGFNGTWNNSSNSPPSAFTLNSAACSVV